MEDVISSMFNPQIDFDALKLEKLVKSIRKTMKLNGIPTDFISKILKSAKEYITRQSQRHGYYTHKKEHSQNILCFARRVYYEVISRTITEDDYEIIVRSLNEDCFFYLRKIESGGKKSVIPADANPTEKVEKSNEIKIEGYPCRYCKSTDTKYIQKQIRSADEPMTVFIMCNKCERQFIE
jgi:DNA-directed RNA polymerase subunit M/transcription elongation factor TFIIS